MKDASTCITYAFLTYLKIILDKDKACIACAEKPYTVRSNIGVQDTLVNNRLVPTFSRKSICIQVFDILLCIQRLFAAKAYRLVIYLDNYLNPERG